MRTVRTNDGASSGPPRLHNRLSSEQAAATFTTHCTGLSTLAGQKCAEFSYQSISDPLMEIFSLCPLINTMSLYSVSVFSPSFYLCFFFLVPMSPVVPIGIALVAGNTSDPLNPMTPLLRLTPGELTKMTDHFHYIRTIWLICPNLQMSENEKPIN